MRWVGTSPIQRLMQQLRPLPLSSLLGIMSTAPSLLISHIKWIIAQATPSFYSTTYQISLGLRDYPDISRLRSITPPCGLLVGLTWLFHPGSLRLFLHILSAYDEAKWTAESFVVFGGNARSHLTQFLLRKYFSAVSFHYLIIHLRLLLLFLSFSLTFLFQVGRIQPFLLLLFPHLADGSSVKR